MVQKVIWVLKGFVIGVACLVPGISAGTLALIMGVYEKIILSIKDLISFSIRKANLGFLLCLIIGFLLAFFCLAERMSLLLSHFPIKLYCFFAGLIIASIPKLFYLTDKTKKSLLLISVVALSVCVFLTLLSNVSIFDQASLFLLFISGFFGFFASVLPGLSGSTVLLILGTYHLVLKLLTGEGKEVYIMLFLIGGVLGLIVAFHCVQYFLKNKKSLFFCVILGFIIGSLPEVLPWEQWSTTDNKSTTIAYSFIFFVMGIMLFFLVEKSGKKVQNEKINM